ncbi:tRNA preQ1(34) S-adenosylmethionine ribosyltransferase-isomerase QueA [Gloeocapsa sp. PCC 73106]|uniref:tRNA preQ1(34) S-adenosylmethionine ribosyltransferase-isomerase QueA n=1 Tax=Gloeocapsa sp. PCC 73106 TaxID=102232 RepID=UPI0002AC5D86|nr:tRNA preQ1(34) S-adenosylmethionine ribosyltransferase-isomerase QueA [Gloeocapsa sp. PCC 73106]ELR99801.1 S-adenosylmethionine:tRNA ribosyltransferase-isomerase [Gloeocapsa sp. PCC 73106]
MNAEQLLSSYDYQLPTELIAQTPAIPRDSSRLLVIDSLVSHQHLIFRDINRYLQPGDLLVVNDTKVIPARLYGRKSTGAPVEILLLEEKTSNHWLALVKPGKRFHQDTEIWFQPHNSSSGQSLLKATVVDKDSETGGRILAFDLPDQRSLWEILPEFGTIPLPPYITATDSPIDQYQTVYAQQPGAVAAPTAGLHFTHELLAKLAQLGVEQTSITLHVGVGTFRPVEVESIVNHKIHQEWLEVNSSTVERIQAKRAQGGRIIAVGTTVVRALETASIKRLQPYRGKTDLFIYPGYKFRAIDALITNFHLPRSSLLMLVSALIGRERLLSLYQEAIDQRYRFYSFGDAMFITPEAKI